MQFMQMLMQIFGQLFNFMGMGGANAMAAQDQNGNNGHNHEGSSGDEYQPGIINRGANWVRDWWNGGVDKHDHNRDSGHDSPAAHRHNPLPGYEQTSGYGNRSMFGSNFHYGVDIGSPAGTNVKSATDAVVVYAGKSQGYGNVVVLGHGKGVYSVYAHLGTDGGDNGIDVRTGQTVSAGTVIGQTGHSGRGTGAHLHYELLVRDGDGARAVSPQRYSLADLMDRDTQQAALRDARNVGAGQSRMFAARVAPNGAALAAAEELGEGATRMASAGPAASPAAARVNTADRGIQTSVDMSGAFRPAAAGVQAQQGAPLDMSNVELSRPLKIGL